VVSHQITFALARKQRTECQCVSREIFFLTTPAAKERLKSALIPLNVEKTITPPVTVVIAWDTEFREKLPRLFPHADMRSYFIGNQPLINETAFRNRSL